MRLRLAILDEKHLRLSGIDPLVAQVLQAVPEILSQRDHPTAERRLLPVPSNDRQLNAEWENFVRDDLRHLLVSAGEICARDLANLEPDPKRKQFSQLVLPLIHADAWMSALNQARLILGARHEVTEADMNRKDLDPAEPRDLAIFHIHALGYLLELFVEQQ